MRIKLAYNPIHFISFTASVSSKSYVVVDIIPRGQETCGEGARKWADIMTCRATIVLTRQKLYRVGYDGFLTVPPN